MQEGEPRGGGLEGVERGQLCTLGRRQCSDCGSLGPRASDAASLGWGGARRPPGRMASELDPHLCSSEPSGCSWLRVISEPSLHMGVDGAEKSAVISEDPATERAGVGAGGEGAWGRLGSPREPSAVTTISSQAGPLRISVPRCGLGCKRWRWGWKGCDG